MSERTEPAKPSADHYIFIKRPIAWQGEKLFQEATKKLRERGAQDMRITAVNADNFPTELHSAIAGWWVEGWNEKQRPQYPPFVAPVTYADTGDKS